MSIEEFGGYLEAESLVLNKQNNCPKGSFNSGRACFNLALKISGVRKIWVPKFICDTVLSPLNKLEIEVHSYNIDEFFEIEELESIDAHSFILYVNYFGLKLDYCRFLSSKFGHRLILDYTQSLFAEVFEENWTFNSLRKFFGLPDGAFLFPPKNRSLEQEFSTNIHYTVEHLYARKIENAAAGYEIYKKNEELISFDISVISSYSKYVYERLDLGFALNRRKKNYEIVHRILGEYNQLNISSSNGSLFYPFLPSKAIDKSKFYKESIYISTLWPELNQKLEETDSFERVLFERLLPIPIDHRYGDVEMEFLAGKILEIIKPEL